MHQGFNNFLLFLLQNGFVSAIPFLLAFFVSVGGGQVADWLRYSKILTTGEVRKVFGTGGVYLSSCVMHPSLKLYYCEVMIKFVPFFQWHLGSFTTLVML